MLAASFRLHCGGDYIDYLFCVPLGSGTDYFLLVFLQRQKYDGKREKCPKI